MSTHHLLTSGSGSSKRDGCIQPWIQQGQACIDGVLCSSTGMERGGTTISAFVSQLRWAELGGPIYESVQVGSNVHYSECVRDQLLI